MSSTSETPAAEAVAPPPTCIDRLAKLPMVEIALMQSAGIYERVKGTHELVNWTLTTAEATAKRAYESAAPVVNSLQQPIHMVDQTICKGMDYVENKFPCVKEHPQQLLEDAKIYSLDKVTLAAGKAHSLAELSWQKANEVLASRYGNMAFNSFGTSANVAEQYFDYYFPSANPEENVKSENGGGEDQVIIADKDGVLDDRVMQTVQTVGRLSNKMARRIYEKVSNQVQSLNKDNAHEYVRSLVALITLQNYLKALHEKATTPAATPPQENKTG